MIKIWKSICLMVVLALVLSLGVVLLPAGEVRAADTGLQSPTATASVGFGWDGGSLPGFTIRAYADDSFYAMAQLNEIQLYYNYGFSIPAGSTIDGIEVRLDAWYSGLATSGTFRVFLSWDGGSGLTAYKDAVLTGTETTYLLGGATDTWGRTWTDAELSDANFRVRIAEVNTDALSYLDWLPVTVYYTPPIVLIDADFSGTPTSGPAPLDVDFTDETTGGTPTSWSWDFGDTGTSTAQNPSHTYQVPGTYTVSLTVNGGEDTETKTDYITASASATTVWVDDDWAGSDPGESVGGHTFGLDAFAIIQDGIDAVVASTVNVLPGTYAENVVVDKALTLQSTSGAAVTIIAPSPPSSPVVEVSMSDGDTFTLNGFTITGGADPDGYGVYIVSGDSDLTDVTITITNNVIEVNENEGLKINDLNGQSVVTIENNEVTDNDDDGIHISDVSDTAQVNITDNTVTLNDDDGIDFDDVSNGSVVTLEDNTLTDNSESGVIFNAVGDSAAVTVQDNDISGNGDHGMDLDDGATDDATIDILDNTFTDNSNDQIHIDYALTEDAEVTIDGNIISDGGDDGIDIEDVGGAESASVVISNNTISGNGDDGVDINYQVDDYQVTVSSCNDIFDNLGYGINNTDGNGKLVDATGNWWGDASGPGGEGPGSGDAVTSNVEYDPWLEAPCGEEVEVEVQADFDASPTRGEAPLTVHFQDRSTGNPTAWDWSFGDGGSSTQQNPTHVYETGGTYSVSLTVTGSTSTVTKRTYIIVEEGGAAAALVIRNLYITPIQAKPRQAIGISAKVANEGGTWGSAEVRLLINGHLEQSVGVGVSPGTAQPVNFTVYKVEAGEYQVRILDATGTFYVMEEPEQPAAPTGGLLAGGGLENGGIIAIIVIGIIIVGGTVLALLFTRRA